MNHIYSAEMPPTTTHPVQRTKVDTQTVGPRHLPQPKLPLPRPPLRLPPPNPTHHTLSRTKNHKSPHPGIIPIPIPILQRQHPLDPRSPLPPPLHSNPNLNPPLHPPPNPTLLPLSPQHPAHLTRRRSFPLRRPTRHAEYDSDAD
jgi:hypothetical protein